jgi:RNA polymerase sigma factor (sigma-70 family)
VTDSTWPDARLVADAQHGDAGAVAALLSGSHRQVRRFAHTLCASPEDAEDAAQEALIILYRRIGTLRASAALASWMFRVVRNECSRAWRLRSRYREPLPDLAVVSAEHEALRRLETGRVAAAIVALTADQRQVLVLRDIRGYSGRMAADALGLGVAAMKSRLHRARATLHHLLRDTPDDRPDQGRRE